MATDPFSMESLSPEAQERVRGIAQELKELRDVILTPLGAVKGFEFQSILLVKICARLESIEARVDSLVETVEALEEEMD